MKPSKEKMIAWLIDSDLNDWEDRAEQFAYLSYYLEKGFVGYENQSYEALQKECEDRDMWDILLEQA
jgi:hypothetical protein